ncbi:MAG: hypothetical protein ACI30M_04475 [Muribaculaceae bacterium]
MRHFFKLISLFFVCLTATAQDGTQDIADKIRLYELFPQPSCDTIFRHDGFNIHAIKKDGVFKHIGLCLFSESMKDDIDREHLDFIETALLYKYLKINNQYHYRLEIINGSISDFKQISPNTTCHISTTDSKKMTADWNLNGKKVSVEIPVGYDIAKSGSRSEIEDNFISLLKGRKQDRKPFGYIDTQQLEAYGDSLFVLRGDSYLRKDINRNVYFEDADSLAPVWSAKFPVESIANLIILPGTVDRDINISCTVLKHEYGEKETFDIPLSQLLSVCEKDGCTTFWGLDKFENGILEGAIFLFNKAHGYDHTLKFTCNPSEIFAGKGALKARVCLFIPTNNVHNLNAEQVK